MNSALQKYVDAASGFTNLTAAKAERIVKQLVRSGEAASDQVGDMVDDLLERQKGNREAATALVRSETTRAVRAMGLATSAEVERLQKQVAELKRELRQMEFDSVGRQPAKKTAAKKSSAKKSSAKKSSAKKSSAKKSGAKKSAAKKRSG